MPGVRTHSTNVHHSFSISLNQDSLILGKDARDSLPFFLRHFPGCEPGAEHLRLLPGDRTPPRRTCRAVRGLGSRSLRLLRPLRTWRKNTLGKYQSASPGREPSCGHAQPELHGGVPAAAACRQGHALPLPQRYISHPSPAPGTLLERLPSLTPGHRHQQRLRPLVRLPHSFPDEDRNTKRASFPPSLSLRKLQRQALPNGLPRGSHRHSLCNVPLCNLSAGRRLPLPGPLLGANCLPLSGAAQVYGRADPLPHAAAQSPQVAWYASTWPYPNTAFGMCDPG
jgi:hypothetical protein